jgi:N4-(beta-N-acetylglucosaminyl)-L-asparaginase
VHLKHTHNQGAGAFSDSEVGGCGETGDGDIMLRFSPCALVVEWMRQGMSPKAATAKIIARIAKYFPNFVGGIIAINKDGEFGAAAYGWTMTYSVANATGVYVFSAHSQQ